MKDTKITPIAIFIILLLMIGAVFIIRTPGPFSQQNIGSWITPASQGAMVYFSKNKGSEVVNEAVSRPWPEPKPVSDEERLQYAMTELLKGPTDQELAVGYFSEIPRGTRLLSVKKTRQGLELNLSDEFASGGGSNSMTQRLQQVTKTVASLPQKTPVYLQVNGEQVETLGGEGAIVTQPITQDPSVTQ